MVTTVVIPIVRRSPSSANSVDMFETIQKRFAWLARFMILIAGGSGFYMLDFNDGWSRYLEPQYWWIHLMTFVWALFMFVFFVAEPCSCTGYSQSMYELTRRRRLCSRKSFICSC